MFVSEFVFHSCCKIKNLIPGIFQAWEQLVIIIIFKTQEVDSHIKLSFYSIVQPCSIWFKCKFFGLWSDFIFGAVMRIVNFCHPLMSARCPYKLLLLLYVCLLAISLLFVVYYLSPFILFPFSTETTSCIRNQTVSKKLKRNIWPIQYII